MSARSPHNKIINSIARAKLKPLGILQKGRSRFWYEDCRWHAISIEFQPSGFSKGSYLNVAISWLWYPKGFLSYDLPHRRRSWVDFRDEDQFRQDFEALSDEAIELARELRAICDTLQSAYERLNVLDREKPGPGGWFDVHLGLLAALNGQPESAGKLLHYVTDQTREIDWEMERKAYLEQAISLLGNKGQLRNWIEDKIAESRGLLGLPRLEVPVLPDH